MTYNGSLPKFTEFPPRIRILEVLPGALELWVATTPETVPCSKLSNEAAGCLSKSEETLATEPVTSLLF